jgi:hypothetical protein
VHGGRLAGLGLGSLADRDPRLRLMRTPMKMPPTMSATTNRQHNVPITEPKPIRLLASPSPAADAGAATTMVVTIVLLISAK